MRIALLAASLLITACNGANDTASSSKNTAPETKLATPVKGQHAMISVKGTVVYKDLEGGFFGFDADNGKKYMPSGLPKELLKHGMVLQLTGTIDTEMMTIQQYGDLLKVASYKVIDDTKASAHNAY